MAAPRHTSRTTEFDEPGVASSSSAAAAAAPCTIPKSASHEKQVECVDLHTRLYNAGFSAPKNYHSIALKYLGMIRTDTCPVCTADALPMNPINGHHVAPILCENDHAFWACGDPATDEDLLARDQPTKPENYSKHLGADTYKLFLMELARSWQDETDTNIKLLDGMIRNVDAVCDRARVQMRPSGSANKGEYIAGSAASPKAESPVVRVAVDEADVYATLVRGSVDEVFAMCETVDAEMESLGYKDPSNIHALVVMYTSEVKFGVCKKCSRKVKPFTPVCEIGCTKHYLPYECDKCHFRMWPSGSVVRPEDLDSMVNPHGDQNPGALSRYLGAYRYHKLQLALCRSYCNESKSNVGLSEYLCAHERVQYKYESTLQSDEQKAPPAQQPKTRSSASAAAAAAASVPEPPIAVATTPDPISDEDTPLKPVQNGFVKKKAHNKRNASLGIFTQRKRTKPNAKSTAAAAAEPPIKSADWSDDDDRDPVGTVYQ